jgi:two-component system OmpR family response regulator
MSSEETAGMQRILVVDDEEFIRDLVGSALRLSNFEVAVAADGATALNTVAKFLPDLIILDVNMPGLDGFEVCRRLRRDGDQTPVVFLTARGDVEDRLIGFTKGGDDYLTKPFSLEELVARTRAVLRRSTARPDESAAIPLTYADLQIDETAHRITRAGQPIDLSPTEFKLLRYLLLNAETVLSKSQILDHIWDYDFDGDTNVVEKYISHLRKKIDGMDPKLIHTVRGFGYVLRTEP